ncbi:MAG: hypothetical protein QM538_05900 [Methylacidiphilales bacterium]|nr:hypothetical protein [Candidatus Methylacidiphilales bacterium]
MNSNAEENRQEKHYHILGGAFIGYVSKGDSLTLKQFYVTNGVYINKLTNFSTISTSYQRYFYSYLYLSDSIVGIELTINHDAFYRKRREFIYACLEYRYGDYCEKDFNLERARKEFKEFPLSFLKYFSILFSVSENNYISLDLDYSSDGILYKVRNAHSFNPYNCKAGFSNDGTLIACVVIPEFNYRTPDLTYGYLKETYEQDDSSQELNRIVSPDGIGIGMRHLFPDDSLYVGWSILSYKTSYKTSYVIEELQHLKFKYIYGYNLKIGWIID